MKTKILKRIRRKTRILIVETTGDFYKYNVYVNGEYEESWTDLSKAINYSWLEITGRGLTDEEKKNLEYKRRRTRVANKGKIVYEN